MSIQKNFQNFCKNLNYNYTWQNHIVMSLEISCLILLSHKNLYRKTMKTPVFCKPIQNDCLNVSKKHQKFFFFYLHFMLQLWIFLNLYLLVVTMQIKLIADNIHSYLKINSKGHLQSCIAITTCVPKLNKSDIVTNAWTVISQGGSNHSLIT